MEIAFLSDSVYPFNKGGKETRSYELSTRLAKKGFDVDFYTMKFWRGKSTKKLDGVNFEGICFERPLYSGKGRSIWQAITFGLSSFKLFNKDFDVMDADHMVYFHLFPAWIICKLRRKKFIVTWHEVWGREYWEEYMGKKGYVGYLIEKLSSKLGDEIIAISEHTKKRLVRDLGVKASKIEVIPNGIDAKGNLKINASKEKSDIIFAGRLNEHKNVDYLIRAVSILKLKKPNVKCIIVGDGPEKKYLISLAKSLGLSSNIIFKGFIEDSNDVLKLIKSSKVFVLPSTREGFGISVIEANSLGIPVVTIKHKDNASKELIKEGKNGFVVKLDEKEISRNVLKAIKSGKGMKKGCVNEAENYDWDLIIDRFVGVYGE